MLGSARWRSLSSGSRPLADEAEHLRTAIARLEALEPGTGRRRSVNGGRAVGAGARRPRPGVASRVERTVASSSRRSGMRLRLRATWPRRRGSVALRSRPRSPSSSATARRSGRARLHGRVAAALAAGGAVAAGRAGSADVGKRRSRVVWSLPDAVVTLCTPMHAEARSPGMGAVPYAGHRAMLRRGPSTDRSPRGRIQHLRARLAESKGGEGGRWAEQVCGQSAHPALSPGLEDGARVGRA